MDKIENKKDIKKVPWLEVVGLFVWHGKWLLLWLIVSIAIAVKMIFKIWFWYF